MFSIIIPLYNKENYILDAINSVLDQTYTEFELIVVNDGSTDNSGQIVEKINDQRIKVINQQNSGVSVARNNGVKNARYNYVAFLDGDDIWGIQYLEAMKSLIEKYPSCDVFFSNYMRLDSKDISENISVLKTDYIKAIYIDDYFDFYNKEKVGMTSSSTVMTKESINSVGGFNENFTRGEDLLLWTELSIRYEVAYIDYIGAIYRKTPDSLSNSSFPKNQDFANYAEDFLEENLQKVKNKISFSKYMLGLIIKSSKYKILEGNSSEARKIILKCKEGVELKRFIKYYLSTFLPGFIQKKVIR